MASKDLVELVEYSLGELPSGWQIDGSHLLVPLQGSSDTITVTAAAAHRLLHTHAMPRIRGLSVFPHCGFHFGEYAEFLIYLEGFGEWPEDVSLRFRVANTVISPGPISLTFRLLFEPIYRDKYVGQDGLDGFSSLRLTGCELGQVERVLHRALFYLNSDYLRPLDAAAVVHHLWPPDRDYDWPDFDSASRIRRTRVRRRSDLVEDPPILLYNDAAVASGDLRFLGFYRVLEYFFRKATLEALQKARLDHDTPVTQLLEIARRDSELRQLQHLLDTVLTRSNRSKLGSYLVAKRLILSPDLAALAKGIYGFRNSIVHAKEQQISDTRLPNPVVDSWGKDPWAYVARECATAAIRKLNKGDT